MGGSITDTRGEKLAEWAMAKKLLIENYRNQAPTFSSPNSCSYIDITLRKELEVRNWRVSEDETLSDHNYIMYEIATKQKYTQQTKYDFTRTDWARFEAEMAKFSITSIMNKEQLKRQLALSMDTAARYARDT